MPQHRSYLQLNHRRKSPKARERDPHSCTKAWRTLNRQYHKINSPQYVIDSAQNFTRPPKKKHQYAQINS